MSKGVKIVALTALISLAFTPFIMMGGMHNNKSGISTKEIADILHAVLKANRSAYAKHVVNRLAHEEGVITASEHWVDDKSLPLPMQMFKLSSVELAGDETGISFDLLSLWAINKGNFPKTDKEREGLIYVLKNPGENYYANVNLEGKNFFLAVYPDRAVSPVCVECHNNHETSPKNDFQTGDLMGGVVIRIPI